MSSDFPSSMSNPPPFHAQFIFVIVSVSRIRFCRHFHVRFVIIFVSTPVSITVQRSRPSSSIIASRTNIDRKPQLGHIPFKVVGTGTDQGDDLTEITHDLEMTFIILVTVRHDHPRPGFTCSTPAHRVKVTSISPSCAIPPRLENGERRPPFAVRISSTWTYRAYEPNTSPRTPYTQRP